MLLSRLERLQYSAYHNPLETDSNICRKSSFQVTLDFRFVAVQSKISAVNKSKYLNISFCSLIP